MNNIRGPCSQSLERGWLGDCPRAQDKPLPLALAKDGTDSEPLGTMLFPLPAQGIPLENKCNLE